MRTIPKYSIAAVLAFTVLFSLATPKVFAIEPCCSITGIDQKSGTVTARENATRRVFTFKVTDAKLLSSLKVGQGVYANFATKQVSVNGFEPCCNIVSLQPPDGAKAANAASPKASPFAPCCNVANVNVKTGMVTAKNNATGALLAFKVTDAKLLSSLQVGQRVYANYAAKQVSINGIVPCCNMASAAAPAH